MQKKILTAVEVVILLGLLGFIGCMAWEWFIMREMDAYFEPYNKAAIESIKQKAAPFKTARWVCFFSFIMASTFKRSLTHNGLELTLKYAGYVALAYAGFYVYMKYCIAPL